MVNIIRNVGKARRRIDRNHLLYLAVVIAVVAGIIVGLVAPDFAGALEPLGKAFVGLVKMMIAPIVFCTIVIGIGSIAKAATVGKVGGLALVYFIVMSTFALAIGLVVGNVLHPGQGLDISSASYDTSSLKPESTQNFLLSIIPVSFFSSLVDGSILQTLFVALLVGFAVQKMGAKGQSILGGIKQLQLLIFRILSMVLWVAPIGAFGAIAAVVGKTGWGAVVALGSLMMGFYLTCAIFVIVVLGLLLRLVIGVNIFSLMKYLAREYLLIVGTSSSEAALPRLIAKMEHLGVSRPVVGITVPTGYSFNLDGTAIYLTMSSLFIASATGSPMSISEQIGLLLFMMVASKGAAGVTGAGLATLAGGLQAFRPDLVNGVGVIVGVDRFMSEARAVTNFTGNAVATMLVGTWTGQIDTAQMRNVLAGRLPFDENTLGSDEHTSSALGTSITAGIASIGSTERTVVGRQ
ncbi:cation:dicarboxylate symporter family transporter [Rathayibacter toxicus]|uniref:cation:dicarboxylate symporter family transporter n=1 Tax=Rathayibacter toxicus TaxID=145458 RepID=UPI000CE844A1|nr:cation:dicarboxylase symporter family transporter [Rathayibacter toxicus]PPI55996.1 C4-dicarboxylate transporter DctA [Rathayibacter toxicus]QOD10215.1 cation:dicarboxylase symporter family transporter [Rathayibacter toxicus]QWL28891.1 cation:dicarboxylase symporter family transporter [Rathayibacter toxicus]